MVQSQPQPHNEIEARLDCMRLCPKKREMRTERRACQHEGVIPPLSKEPSSQQAAAPSSASVNVSFQLSPHLFCDSFLLLLELFASFLLDLVFSS